MAFLSFFGGITVPLAISLFARDKQRPFLVYLCVWSRFLVFISGVKVKVSGLENIPNDKGALLVCNHQGVADGIILFANLPVIFRAVMKKEMLKIPVVGWYFKKAGYFPIDRDSTLSAYRTIDSVTKIIRNGGFILVFPEGTRTKNGELGAFKSGSLFPALKSGAPIIPIAISGSFNIIPSGSWIIHAQPVKLSIGKPGYMKPEDDHNSKIKEIREAIAKML